MDRFAETAAERLDPLGLELPFSESPLDGQGEAISTELLQDSPFSGELERSALAWGDAEEPYHQRRRKNGDEPLEAGVTFPSGVTLAICEGAVGKDEEHWDPSSTGLPLLDTGPAVQGRKLSDNFTVRELVTSGGKAAPVARIAPQLVTALQALRTRAGKAVRITSGYRSWKRNKAVYAASGKKPTLSRHCSGQAVDLKIAGMRGTDLARLAIDAIGTDFGLGIGPDFIHVDVRPSWTLWTYMKGAPGAAALRDIGAYRLAALKGTKPAPPGPGPAPGPGPSPGPSPASANRIVIAKHPMLASHRGRGNDLILKWNTVPADGVMDIVVHFHGFGDKDMNVLKTKEPISGLDFADPKGSGTGRIRPTLAILPKGNYVGDQKGQSTIAYKFTALMPAGALDRFIDDALTRVGKQVGRTLSRGRLILTGHSGGGAPILTLLANTAIDPDEIFIFDGMYNPGGPIAKWARKRIDRELASPGALPPALRVQTYPPAKTLKHSTDLWAMICPMIAPAAAARLRPYFRVERTTVVHNDSPGTFGWRLLADSGASLPSVTLLPCKTDFVPAGEARAWLADPVSSTEWLDSPLASETPHGGQYLPEAREREDEDLAWLDFEGGTAAPEFEEFDSEGEGEGAGEDEQEDLADGLAAELHAEPNSAREWFDAPFGEDEEEGPFGEDEEEGPFGEDEEDFDWEGEERFDPAGFDEGSALNGELFAEELAGQGFSGEGATLRRGARGPAVAALQEALNRLGAGLDVDGRFGPRTETAVKDFQRRSGLAPDGIVGPKTRAALAAALGGGIRPGPPPAPATDLPSAIVRIAEEEDRLWNVPGAAIKERDSAAVPILQRYYRDGVGETVTAAQLQDEAWQKAHPWSSVFISYVMRTAGAGSHFHYSRAHVGYIRAARRNRLDNAVANPFWAYRATEVAPQLGDVICKARRGSGATYDNIGDGTHRDTHGDIVIAIRPGLLTVIGGNVHDNVYRKPIRILADGRLALDGDQDVYFAVVRCRGPAAAVPPVPVPPTPVPPTPVPPTPVPPSPPVGRKLSPREFVQVYGPSARITQARFGIPPLVTLAQAAIESTWGRDASRFNLFGIKASARDPEDTRQLLETTEVYDRGDLKLPNQLRVEQRKDGRYVYHVLAWFRAYPNAAAAFDDHGRVLRLKRYRKAFDYPNDPYQFGREIARARYNTDPVLYEDTLMKVIRMLEKASDGTLRESEQWEGPYEAEEEEEEEFDSEGFLDEDSEESFEQDLEYSDSFEELEEEAEELDPTLADIAERIMAREEPQFEDEAKKRKATHCFTSDDVDRVRLAYEDNATAASNDSGARCSCIVMLNVALAALMNLETRQVSARTGSARKVDMARITAKTIEKAMAQLKAKGFADAPIRLNFFNSRNGTAGVRAPVRLKQSLQQTVLNHSKAKKCWYAFGLSIMDGYHSVLLLVDRTGTSPSIYWLDQFATGLDDDVTTTLDDRVTSKTIGWWQAVMNSKKKGYNTTIRLWPLLKR